MNLAQDVVSKIETNELDSECFRRKIRNQIGSEMKRWMNSSDESVKSPDSIAVYAHNMEVGVFNATLEKCESMNTPKLWKNELFVDVYLRILHSMYHAMQHKHIQDGLRDRTLRAHQLPFMSYQEIYPEKWTSLLDNKVKREQNMFRSNVTASTDSYTCRRCKGKECTFYQMQTRSADEPMTIFISCISCGNQWKQ